MTSPHDFNSIMNMQAQNSMMNMQAHNSMMNIQAPNQMMNIPAPNSMMNMQTSNSMMNMQASNSMMNMQASNSMMNMQASNSMMNLQAPNSMMNMQASNSMMNLQAPNSMMNVQAPNLMMNIQTPTFQPSFPIPNLLQQPRAETTPENTGQARGPSQELTPAILCKLGQETVQEIITRTNDVFQLLKNLQPPNGSMSGSTASAEKKTRIQEQLRNVKLLFFRLKTVYNKCCILTKNLDMGYTLPETLIPMKDDWDGKLEERNQTEGYRLAVAERAALREEVSRVNQEIKCALDLERAAIFRINTMCSMTKS